MSGRTGFARLGIRRRLGIPLVIACLVSPSVSARAEDCGDADGNRLVTVSDGVNVLSAAVGLPGGKDCIARVCDVDGFPGVTVTDGVNVLGIAAELSDARRLCPESGITLLLGDIVKSDGTHGSLVPGSPPDTTPGAPALIENVDQQGPIFPGQKTPFSVLVKFGNADAQAAAVGTATLIVDVEVEGVLQDGHYEQEIDAPPEGDVDVTVVLTFSEELIKETFTLEFAVKLGEIVSVYFPFAAGVSQQSILPSCGNGKVDNEVFVAGMLIVETCDPPNSIAPNGETCRDDCTYCGDEFLQGTDGEECDAPLDSNCTSVGQVCDMEQCLCVPRSTCGDGRKDPGETCDTGTRGGTCRDDCTFCGDGITNGDEQCDAGDGTTRTTSRTCRVDQICGGSCTCVFVAPTGTPTPGTGRRTATPTHTATPTPRPTRGGPTSTRGRFQALPPTPVP